MLSIMSITITKDNTNIVLKAIQDMAKKHVLIGIPSANNSRNDGAITNASIGYINEFGSTANNIPPRPFLQPGVKKVSTQCAEVLKRSAQNILDGKDSIERGLNVVGTIARDSVKKTIVASEGFSPLAEKTLAQRARKGFKGTKPLIQTGQLINSITYVVRDN